MGNTPSVTDKKGSTYDADGYNGYGFHRTTELHKDTGSIYNKNGETDRGFSWNPYKRRFVYSYIFKDRRYVNPQGYDVNGWKQVTATGYIHDKTQTEYNLDGYDYYGYNCNGRNKAGRTRAQESEIAMWMQDAQYH